MSYVDYYSQHESITQADQPLVRMVVLPSVLEKLNSHHSEHPEDSIYTDWQGGSILAEEQTITARDLTIGSVLLRECVRYAELALSCEGIRITNHNNQVLQTVLPEHFDDTFFIKYHRRTAEAQEPVRKMGRITLAAERHVADRLSAIAAKHETLLGDVFTYGYEFRTQMQAAMLPGTAMTLLARNGKESRLLVL